MRRIRKNKSGYYSTKKLRIESIPWLYRRFLRKQKGMMNLHNRTLPARIVYKRNMMEKTTPILHRQQIVLLMLNRDVIRMELPRCNLSLRIPGSIHSFIFQSRKSAAYAHSQSVRLWLGTPNLENSRKFLDPCVCFTKDIFSFVSYVWYF